MARTGGDGTFIDFSKGKNTESNPLNSPAGAFRTLINCDISPVGALSRRLGLDFEKDFTIRRTGEYTVNQLADIDASAYPWQVADEDAGFNFVVVRIGSTLDIYDMTSGTALSNSFKDTIDITSFEMSASQSARSIIDTSSGKGVFIVTGEFYRPFYLEYDSTADTFSANAISMEIRDFTGVEDGLDIDERPSTLSDEHKYNLKNQGWTDSRLTSVSYPSNADISHLGVTTDSGGNTIFSVSHLNEQTFGNTLAPRGHYVLDAFDRDRVAVSDIFGLPTDGTNRRPTTSAFYSGRAWYGGERTRIYFSQILEDLSKIGKCYQEQDPTAEDFNELLDTDGGVVNIPEAGQVVKILALDEGIVVLGTNGVWYISGGTENFTANTFSVTKVTEVGCLSTGSAVKVENAVMYWSVDGIYILTLDAGTLKLVASNLSETTIKTDYQAIPAISKGFVQGVYDNESKNVFWFYNNTSESSTSTLTIRKTHVLVYNAVFNAFYDYEMADTGAVGFTPFACNAIKTGGRSNGLSVEFVTLTDGEILTLTSGESITVTTSFDDALSLPLKVLSFTPDGNGDYGYTFSEYCSVTFLDWFSFDAVGKSFDSIVETVPITSGEVMRDKQATYLMVYFNRQRGGFGSISGTGRPDPSFGYLVTQSPIEVLRDGAPKVQVYQMFYEVLELV